MNIDSVNLQKTQRNNSKPKKNLSESKRTKLPTIDLLHSPKDINRKTIDSNRRKLIPIKTLNFNHLNLLTNKKELKYNKVHY